MLTRVKVLRWLKGFTQPPKMTYIVHGEPVAAEALHRRFGRAQMASSESPERVD